MVYKYTYVVVHIIMCMVQLWEQNLTQNSIKSCKFKTSAAGRNVRNWFFIGRIIVRHFSDVQGKKDS